MTDGLDGFLDQTCKFKKELPDHVKGFCKRSIMVLVKFNNELDSDNEMFALIRDLQKLSPSNSQMDVRDSPSKEAVEEEKLEKKLKMQEDSEELLSILNLLNRLHEKLIHSKRETDIEIVKKIETFYRSGIVQQFIHVMSERLQKANIDITGTIRNLILCVFAVAYCQIRSVEKEIEETKEGD